MSASDTSAHYEAARQRLDLDTHTKGTQGPFEDWESDHTALYHVLRDLHREGLSLEGNAEEIATLILHSRWAAAYRATGTGER